MRVIRSYALLFSFLLSPFSATAADPSAKPAAATARNNGDSVSADVATDEAASADSSPSAESRPRGKTGAKPSSIVIITQPGGLKTLTINFPWSLFPDSSIEMRLLPGSDAKGVEVTPIYFHEHLKGRVRDEFFNCLDHAEHGGQSYNFTKDKLVYTIIGRRNSLGNQGVHVQVANEVPKKSDNPAAAYLQLDTWAIDKKTLSLDLARDEFARPGTLFVWFFRGDKSVWEEQVRWPGYK
jgi:hypothetical protein